MNIEWVVHRQPLAGGLYSECTTLPIKVPVEMAMQFTLALSRDDQYHGYYLSQREILNDSMC